MEQALIKLIESGLPMANTAIVWYFVIQALGYLVTGAVFLGIAGIVYRLVRIWQRYRFK